MFDNLLKNMVAKLKRDWYKRLGEAFEAYRTAYNMPTQSTSFAFVYGPEVLLPLEFHIPLLHIAIQEGLTKDENHKLCLAELEALDEKELQRNKSWNTIKSLIIILQEKGPTMFISS